jgi:pyruvate, orthophosphate dikinase
MTRAGVPVPPASPSPPKPATNSAKTASFPEGQWDQQLAAMKAGKSHRQEVWRSSNPLLVSCRSGAKFSMPGMMNTILNIGLNDEVVEGLIKLTSNPRFVWDLLPPPGRNVRHHRVQSGR